MPTTTKRTRANAGKQFVVMSVPTDAGAHWFVWDRVTRRSVACEDRAAAVHHAALREFAAVVGSDGKMSTN